MSDRSCPCGARLNRSTAVRSLGSPYFRMFMSIRTMKTLTSTTKVCNICCHLYNKWRRENPEFSNMVNNIDSDDSEIEAIDTNSVRKKLHFFAFSTLLKLFQADSTDTFSQSDHGRTTVNDAATATKTITLQMNATGSSHE